MLWSNSNGVSGEMEAVRVDPRRLDSAQESDRVRENPGSELGARAGPTRYEGSVTADPGQEER
jgi:hypothetical protein